MKNINSIIIVLSTLSIIFGVKYELFDVNKSSVNIFGVFNNESLTCSC